ncbi:MAG: hypothetical protein L3J75_12630 [Methylococcaceae bacterium]|nr:hypothetical protein [Methylococcaceae bacterium]
MYKNKLHNVLRLLLGIVALLIVTPSWAIGFTPISSDQWKETSVRKVLHIFAYGGLADDNQIKNWADMKPQDAIQEMLTFNPVNEKLSPAQDATVDHCFSLEELQLYWSTNTTANLMPLKRQRFFAELNTLANGTTKNLSSANLQNTWIEAANKHGCNPFRQKVGLWLTNDKMAVSLKKVKAPLIRGLYDRALDALDANASFDQVLALGASSAAVARQYGHQYNRYINNRGTFKGNDDFAREFHQLFFENNGLTEDPNYHENVTIEHTAWLLTGMNIDKMNNAFGSTSPGDWWLDVIDYSNHFDMAGRNLKNFSLHHAGDLEILHTMITGLTAEEKIYDLASVAIEYQESLDALPVAIINYFADDNLNSEKIITIREAWQAMVSKDLLKFLQDYAISSTLHRVDTVKFRNAYDRNMTIYVQNTVDNQEAYHNSTRPKFIMAAQDSIAFIPANDVFGVQNSEIVSNNANIFKDAYNRAVNTPYSIIKTSEGTWLKDWAQVIPNKKGYQVKNVAKWLWKRFTADPRKFGALEKAYVYSLLAKGQDLGYLVDPNNPYFTVNDLRTKSYHSLYKTLSKQSMDLNSKIPSIRKEWNRRIGLAINFISMTPYMFALEGN